MYYYAYGSNLSTKYIRDYCHSAEYVMRAQLPNYHIEFRRFSTDLQGGISTIMEAPGELVHGVIYEIPEAEILELDILEDVPLGLYKRESFLVLDETGSWQSAALYRIVTPSGPYEPSSKYIEMMIEGANEHNLAAHYIDWLKSLRSSAISVHGPNFSA